jgi:hypothetical protein
VKRREGEPREKRNSGREGGTRYRGHRDIERIGSHRGYRGLFRE